MNLVTVCGHNTTMLKHMLNHYKDMVDDIFVVVYLSSNSDKVLSEVKEITNDLNIDIHKTTIEEPFNWERVTYHYNKTTSLKPNDWWIVSDDDELQLYSKPIEEIIDECEDSGYDFVTGGFIDRIGENGKFPKITLNSNVWKEMPNAGFFRYPLSGANPNKVTLMKGSIDVVSGQHYVDFNDGTNSWGKHHPKRYPIEKNFTQVHHFKWDYSVLQRLKQVSSSNLKESFSNEYLKMLNEIQNRNFQLDISNREWLFQRIESIDYQEYRYWDKLRKKIIEV